MASIHDAEMDYNVGLIRDALRKNYIQLTEHLKAAVILPALFEQDVISLETKQELDCVQEKAGSIKFAKAVVDKILETSNTKGDLNKFCEILRDEQPVLYEIIVKWMEDVKSDGTVEHFAEKSNNASRDMEKRFKAQITELQDQLVRKDNETANLKQELDRKNGDLDAVKQRLEKLELHQETSAQPSVSTNQVRKKVKKISENTIDFRQAVETHVASLHEMSKKTRDRSTYKTEINYDHLHWTTSTQYVKSNFEKIIREHKRKPFSNKSCNQYNTVLKDEAIKVRQRLEVTFQPSLMLDEDVALTLPCELVELSTFPSTLPFQPGDDIIQERDESFSTGEMTVTVPAMSRVEVIITGTEICYETSLEMLIRCQGQVTGMMKSAKDKDFKGFAFDVRGLEKQFHKQHLENVSVDEKGLNFIIHGKLRASCTTNVHTTVQNRYIAQQSDDDVVAIS